MLDQVFVCVFPVYLNLFKAMLFLLLMPENEFRFRRGHEESFLKT